jgi:hypothetical protein
MPHTTQSPVAALRSKAKKLEALATLLEDREIAGEIAGIMLTNSEAISVDHSFTQPRRTFRPRTTKKRRGALERKVFEVVKGKATSVTAKDVTRMMEAEGFSFAAEDHQVAVSKALRQLAKKNKIHAERNGHAKAPIIYTFLPHQVPVRENARSHGGALIYLAE